MSLYNRSFKNIFKLNFAKRLQHTQVKVNSPLSSISSPTGPVFRNAQYYADRVALRDTIASYTYANLFMSANELSKEITKLVNGKTNERVMFLCPNDANYVVTLWAIWMSGQIAVPLSPLHPKNILLYYANDTNSNLLITTTKYVDLMGRVAKNTSTKLHVLDEKLKLNATEKLATSLADLEAGHSGDFYERNNAMILYTSGTTGNPKGVVLSHKNLDAQVNALLDAWKWTPNDVLLHTLPLHHVHGIVNALLCPLYAGAKIIMLPKFNANTVWSYLLGITAKPDDRKMTIYMAVPTIYSKLIDEYEKLFIKDHKMREYIKNNLKSKVRVMISGSAPLPQPVFEKWQEISGHQLLERYGMTEIGMALSNVYEDKKEPGYVGVPLPGISVKLVSQKEGCDDTVLEASNKNGEVSVKYDSKEKEVSGELYVKGDGIFKEYFNRAEATKSEFTSDGWFKTGDLCQYSSEKKKFKMLGRKSVDIIKSGGYKLSALQIETQLLSHPNIKEIAVVALPDDKWGEKVAAVVVTKDQTELTLESLNEWAKDHMPKYSLPKVLKVVDTVPKNAMGKINKRELVKNLFSNQ